MAAFSKGVTQLLKILWIPCNCYIIHKLAINWEKMAQFPESNWFQCPFNYWMRQELNSLHFLWSIQINVNYMEVLVTKVLIDCECNGFWHLFGTGGWLMTLILELYHICRVTTPIRHKNWQLLAGGGGGLLQLIANCWFRENMATTMEWISGS